MIENKRYIICPYCGKEHKITNTANCFICSGCGTKICSVDL